MYLPGGLGVITRICNHTHAIGQNRPKNHTQRGGGGGRTGTVVDPQEGRVLSVQSVEPLSDAGEPCNPKLLVRTFPQITNDCGVNLQRGPHSLTFVGVPWQSAAVQLMST